uniref:LSDAT_euk domain-containing protein n=1 Tax=Macrostomum lignano TaxID=282301 RepID=A0A1I8FM79_9PLAT
ASSELTIESNSVFYCSVSGSRKLIIICKSYLSELMDSGSEYGDFSDYEDEGDGLPNGLAMHSMVTEPERDIYQQFPEKRVLPVLCARANSPRICCCNRSAAWHASKAAAAAAVTDITDARADTLSRTARMPKRWTVDGCTATARTDAYGVLRFENFEFTRLGQNAQLLTKTWRIPEPELIVSVTGGAKKMRPMSDKIIKKLRQGIINIATKTKTWIVTGGFNLGTNKLVGEAIRDYQLAGGSERDVVLIGVCPWGSVRDKECLLVSEDKSLERRPASVHLPKPRQHRAGEGPGGAGAPAPHPLPAVRRRHRVHVRRDEIETSGPASEKKVAEQMVRRRSRGDGSDLRSVTPCVHLIIEGGRKTCKRRLVSVETGSRSWLSRAPAELPTSSPTSARTRELESVRDRGHNGEHFSSEFEPDSSEMAQPGGWLMKLAEPAYQRMLNVYDAESMDPNEQLDRVILTTFLRQTSLSVLNLAMAWNRPTWPAQEIFSSERKAKWEQLTGRDLEYSMLRALARNQTEFVSLLFDHGIKHCTAAEPGDAWPTPLTARAPVQLADGPSPRQSATPRTTKARRLYQERLPLRAVGLYVSAKSGGVLRSPYPRRDRSSYQAEDGLLIWSIVVQRTEAWPGLSGDRPTAATCPPHRSDQRHHRQRFCVSAMMLRNMKVPRPSPNGPRGQRPARRRCDSFEGLAAGVLATCNAQDKQKTLDTLRPPALIGAAEDSIGLLAKSFVILGASAEHSSSSSSSKSSKAPRRLWRKSQNSSSRCPVAGTHSKNPSFLQCVFMFYIVLQSTR